MSDKPQADKEKAPAAGTQKKAAAPKPGVMGMASREKKKKWTQERCKKFAGRFASETDWKDGAPSSYKAAEANGWMKECCTCFKNTAATATKAGKTYGTKGKKLPKSA